MLFLMDIFSVVPVVHAVYTREKQVDHRENFARIVDEVARLQHHTLIVCLQRAKGGIPIVFKRLSMMKHINRDRHQWQSLIIVADFSDHETVREAATNYHLPIILYPSWETLQKEVVGVQQNVLFP